MKAEILVSLQDKDVKSHVGYYWKQMGVVLVASIFLFVYEFCER